MSQSVTQLGLVPSPEQLILGGGRLTLPERVTTSGPQLWVDRLRALVGPGSGLTFGEQDDEPLLRLVVDRSRPPAGYHLLVDESGVTLSASDDDGLLHGIQTLRQLLPSWACGLAPLPGREVSLPHVEVTDSPRFAWRGVHLDVGRHFQPLASLFRFVDLLALHKINIFHLHLTEDQGWRFEVRKYPLLTEIGAVRSETHYPAWPAGDGTPHGGFYTQDQLRSLVGYAQQRGVTIVPEIDLPGHVRALLTAYPERGEDTTGEGFTVATGFGVFDEVLHLSDETVSMVEDIFTELLDVFPSEFIHVGGDECPTVQWQGSEAAQELARERGLVDVVDLQRWFTEHLRDWLGQRGRRLVGWDEIVEDAEVPGAVVMSWRGTEPGIKALQLGNDVVMAPHRATYFDYYQDASTDEPYAIGGHLPLAEVIAYNPTDGIPAELVPGLLGVQGQLWAEYMHSPERVEYMAFPRVAALAETAWSPGPPDEGEFTERLQVHLGRLDASGVNYRPLEGPHPWQVGGTGRYARPPKA